MITKHILLVSFLGCFLNVCQAQWLPVSYQTYENVQSVDDYYGETDSTVLKNNIRTRRVFYKKDTLVLIELTHFEGGKKTLVQDFDYEYGKLERSIRYNYGEGFLEAEIVHYPSRKNHNLFPAQQYHLYLTEMRSDGTHMLYKRDDSVSNVVRMRMRHTWNKDGTILFEAFNRENKLIKSHVLKPFFTWEEYQKFPRHAYPRTVDKGDELYEYNEGGKLLLYQVKSMGRKWKYTYDKRGLLLKTEFWESGKLAGTKVYEYE